MPACQAMWGMFTPTSEAAGEKESTDEPILGTSNEALHAKVDLVLKATQGIAKALQDMDARV